MASTGSNILGAIAAVIGFYVGGVQGAVVGWQIGSAVGGAIDPERIDGPRLADRKVQVSSYGVSIPILYGGDAGAGNVVWSTDLVEHDVEQDGKGGPVVTLHTYSASCAVLIGEGPIAGIRRIWAGAKLVYDTSETADAQTQISSFLFSQYVTFYPGDEDQLPDPTIEAAKGVGNVTAYRGSCYVVFKDIPLAAFNNQLPQFRFETSGPGVGTGTDGEITYEPLRIGPWGGDMPINGYGPTQYQAGVSGGGGYQYFTDFGTAAAYNASIGGHPAANATSAYSETFIGYSTSLNANANVFPGGATLTGDPQYVTYHMAVEEPDAIIGSSVGQPFPDSALLCGPMRISGATANDGIVYWTEDAAQVGTTSSYLTKLGCGAGSGAYTSVNNCTNYTFNTDCPGAFPTAQGNAIIGMRAERLPAPPPDVPGCPVGDPCLLGLAQIPNQPNFCINCDGLITPNSDITYEIVTGTFKQLAAITYSGGALVQNAVGPVHLPTDPEYDDAVYWETKRAEAASAGTMPIGNASPYPVIVSSVAKGTAHPVDRIVAPESNTTLDLIVADVWVRAGGTPAQCNVTALEGIVVQGYTIPRQMPARQALVQLQTAYWFDFVESGREIKAVLRGGAPVVTIGLDDLGASESDEEAVAVVPMRAQETELPATVNVSHPLRSKGYEIDTQRDRRITTGSQQTISVELAVVTTEQHAAEIASVLLYTSWTERTERSWSTTRKYAKYEPTDVVELNDGEFLYRVRIVDRSEEGQIIKWRGVDEAPAVYSPVVTPGIGAGAGAIGSIPFAGPMKLELIDSPILLDSNNDPGFYAAASGYTSAYPGGIAYKSVDAGASYSNVKELKTQATMGYALDVLGDFAGGNTVDEGNTVTIRMHSGTLANITQEQLLNQGNAAILGSELIQFKRAELIAANTYRLTGLLRGRQGTEQHMGTHAAMDRFVLFTPTTVYRMPGSLADLGVAALWKGVPVGQTLADSNAQPFTNTGAGLKPLSPVHLHAVNLGGGQYRVSWVRRTRIGGKWRDGVDVPLGETSESYTVVTSTGATINSTTTTGASTLDVAAAPGDTVQVFMLSTAIGRGFPAQVTL